LKKLRIPILLVLLSFSIAACGGGGGSNPAPASKTATLKLSTTGTPSENLAGVGITITLPTGVTPVLNFDGTVAATVVAVSGAAVPGTIVSPVYTPASGATKGKLVIAVASSIVAGFGAGEYATVVLAATAGTNPLQTDFVLTDFRPIAVSNGADVTGLTAVISGYALQ